MAKNLKKFRKDLEQIISSSKSIYILGHNDPDFDAIGSALGLAKICQLLKKDPYIVIKEDNIRLQPKVKAIKDENIDQFNIISVEEYLDQLTSLIPEDELERFYEADEFDKKEYLQQIKMKRSTLIITDTNNLNLVSLKDYLGNFQNVVVIDHHERIRNQYFYPTLSFIDNEYSSASEIVATMLHSYQEQYCESIATALAAGIILDTDNFKKNDTDNTHQVFSVLKKNGVTNEKLNALFAKDFETERIISNLVFDNGNCKTFRNLIKGNNVSIILNRTNPEFIYKPEVLAMAADKRQEFDDIDTTIVFGYTFQDGERAIKASVRTNGYIDGSKITRGFCTKDSKRAGGGAIRSAAMLLESDDILAEEQAFIEYLKNTDSEEFKPKKKIKK